MLDNTLSEQRTKERKYAFSQTNVMQYEWKSSFRGVTVQLTVATVVFWGICSLSLFLRHKLDLTSRDRRSRKQQTRRTQCQGQDQLGGWMNAFCTAITMPTQTSVSDFFWVSEKRLKLALFYTAMPTHQKVYLEIEKRSFSCRGTDKRKFQV